MSENAKAPEQTNQNDNEPRQLDGDFNKKRSRKKLWIVVLCCLALVGAGAWAAYYFINRNVRPVETSGDSKKATPAELQNEFLSMTTNGEQVKTKAYLERQLDLTNSPEEKALVYDYLVSTATSQDKTEDALKYALSSYELVPTEPRAGKVASLEKKLGNKAEALKYYKIGLSKLSGSADPYASIKKSAYENTIKELEK